MDKGLYAALSTAPNMTKSISVPRSEEQRIMEELFI